MRFIDDHVGNRADDGLRCGVESICAQLTEPGATIAASTYYTHRDRPRSAREVRDTALKPNLAGANADNYGVDGARRVWLTLKRQRPCGAPPIARCTVERLMAELGLRAALRGKVKRTTISDPHAAKPHDLVDRNFSTLAPDRLWVTNALAMAIDSRLGQQPNKGTILYCDQRVQFGSWAFTRRAKEAGLLTSMGSIGDSYVDSMIESFWSRMQVELLDSKSWNTRIELSNGMFEYLEIWHNRKRRHSQLGWLTPKGFERNRINTLA